MGESHEWMTQASKIYENILSAAATNADLWWKAIHFSICTYERNLKNHWKPQINGNFFKNDILTCSFKYHIDIKFDIY